MMNTLLDQVQYNETPKLLINKNSKTFEIFRIFVHYLNTCTVIISVGNVSYMYQKRSLKYVLVVTQFTTVLSVCFT